MPDCVLRYTPVFGEGDATRARGEVAAKLLSDLPGLIVESMNQVLVGLMPPLSEGMLTIDFHPYHPRTYNPADLQLVIMTNNDAVRATREALRAVLFDRIAVWLRDNAEPAKSARIRTIEVQLQFVDTCGMVYNLKDHQPLVTWGGPNDTGW